MRRRLYGHGEYKKHTQDGLGFGSTLFFLLRDGYGALGFGFLVLGRLSVSVFRQFVADLYSTGFRKPSPSAQTKRGFRAAHKKTWLSYPANPIWRCRRPLTCILQTGACSTPYWAGPLLHTLFRKKEGSRRCNSNHRPAGLMFDSITTTTHNTI